MGFRRPYAPCLALQTGSLPDLDAKAGVSVGGRTHAMGKSAMVQYSQNTHKRS